MTDSRQKRHAWSLLLVSAMARAVFAQSTFPATFPAKLPANLAAAPELTVAVLDFNASVPGSPDLGSQVSETLTAMLGSETGLRLVERAGLARTLQEHELSLSGLTRPDDAIRVGQLVGAKILVTGRAFVLENTLYLTAKVIDTETGRVEGVLVKGKADAGISDLLPQLSERIAAKVRDAGAKLAAAPDAADPVPALKQKLAAVKLPRVSVSIREEHYGEVRHVIDPAAETEMRLVLQALGFELATEGIGATTTPTAQPANVTLTGEAFSEFAARVGNLVSCSARAEVKISDAAGKVVWSDRTTTRAADLSENIAGKTALQKAGRELALRIGNFYADAKSR